MHVSCMSMRQTSILGFVKSTSRVGCVGGESNAPVDFNVGKPTRLCTSGIDCFGVEDGTVHPSSPALVNLQGPVVLLL